MLLSSYTTIEKLNYYESQSFPLCIVLFLFFLSLFLLESEWIIENTTTDRLRVTFCDSLFVDPRISFSLRHPV